jgi:hypothetical protein
MMLSRLIGKLVGEQLSDQHLSVASDLRIDAPLPAASKY